MDDDDKRYDDFLPREKKNKSFVLPNDDDDTDTNAREVLHSFVLKALGRIFVSLSLSKGVKTN